MAFAHSPIVSRSINDLCNQVCGGLGPCGAAADPENTNCWPECAGHSQCWTDMKTFIAEATGTFDIGAGEGQTQVALVTFSTHVTTQFGFGDHTSSDAVSRAVDELE